MQESVDTVKGDLPRYRVVQVEQEQADPSGTILRVSQKEGLNVLIAQRIEYRYGTEHDGRCQGLLHHRGLQ